MIFRPVRISELEKDVEFKKEIFTSSKQALFETAKKEFRPTNLFKTHPQSFFGMGLGMAGFGSVLFAVGHLLGFRKKGAIWNLLKMGWAFGFAHWGISKLLKTVFPFAGLLVQYWLKKHLSKKV